MKTPAAAHQLMSIQCTVNTYCEQRQKGIKKIILKYPGWETIKVHDQLSNNISIRNLTTVQRVLFILSGCFLTDSPVIKYFGIRQAEIKVWLLFLRGSPHNFNCFVSVRLRLLTHQQNFIFTIVYFSTNLDKKKVCVRPVSQDIWMAWEVLK